MVEKYAFGLIIINGKEYRYDVEVRWTGEVLKWWRKEGHIFDVEDVKRAVAQNPDIIILGTGDWGMAQVTERCKNFIREKGIELIINKTKDAVEAFNTIVQNPREKKKVIALFHLTC